MTMKFFCAACLVMASLGGCAVYTPAPIVVEQPTYSPPPGRGGFCPPGQAKKGNC